MTYLLTPRMVWWVNVPMCVILVCTMTHPPSRKVTHHVPILMHIWFEIVIHNNLLMVYFDCPWHTYGSISWRTFASLMVPCVINTIWHNIYFGPNLLQTRPIFKTNPRIRVCPTQFLFNGIFIVCLLFCGCAIYSSSIYPASKGLDLLSVHWVGIITTHDFNYSCSNASGI